jgi:hypothetical protein
LKLHLNNFSFFLKKVFNYYLLSVKTKNFYLFYSYNYLITVNDAYGNVPRDGMLEGSKYSLGHYHSCLEVNVQDFRGQYCSALAIMLPSAALVSNKDADSSLSPVLPPLANAPSGVNVRVLMYSFLFY